MYALTLAQNVFERLGFTIVFKELMWSQNNK